MQKTVSSHLVIFKDVYKSIFESTDVAHALFGRQGYVKKGEQNETVYLDLIFHSIQYFTQDLPEEVLLKRVIPPLGINLAIPVFSSLDKDKIKKIYQNNNFLNVFAVKSKGLKTQQKPGSNQLDLIQRSLDFYEINPNAQGLDDFVKEKKYKEYWSTTPEKFFQNRFFFPDQEIARQEQDKLRSLKKIIDQHYYGRTQ